MKHCNIPGYPPLPVIYWNIKTKVIPITFYKFIESYIEKKKNKSK